MDASTLFFYVIIGQAMELQVGIENDSAYDLGHNMSVAVHSKTTRSLHILQYDAESVLNI
jgi:hypothetical protein